MPTVKKEVGNTTKTLIKIDNIEFPNYGNQFGQLVIEDCGVDASLFFGDGNIALRNGVGVYSGSFIPGYGGTILVAGHNNTYFNGLKNAQPGQIVTIKTSYGNYTYEIFECILVIRLTSLVLQINAFLYMQNMFPVHRLIPTLKRGIDHVKEELSKQG